MADAQELLVSAIQKWIDRGEPTTLEGVPLVEGQHEPIANAIRAARRDGERNGELIVMNFFRRRADEWRRGASSVKGYHLPLKHVYQWLRDMEDSQKSEDRIRREDE